MKNGIRQRTAQLIGHALQVHYRPERIVLFGSCATGGGRQESDIDLLIIKRTSQPFHKRLATVRKLVSSFRRGIPFDPIVVTPREVEKRLQYGDQFLAGILQSGTVLYAKP